MMYCVLIKPLLGQGNGSMSKTLATRRRGLDFGSVELMWSGTCLYSKHSYRKIGSRDRRNKEAHEPASLAHAVVNNKPCLKVGGGEQCLMLSSDLHLCTLSPIKQWLVTPITFMQPLLQLAPLARRVIIAILSFQNWVRCSASIF